MNKELQSSLRLENGVVPHTLEDIRQHFDLPRIIEAYKSGELLRWCQERYYENEVEDLKIRETLHFESDEELGESLRILFRVEETMPAPTDSKHLQQIQENLRAYTDNPEILNQADRVAFDQEELAVLLSKGTNPIYLCGSKFTLPASKRGRTYIGVNKPEVELSGGDCFDDSEITVQNVKTNLTSDKSMRSLFHSRLDSLGTYPSRPLKDWGSFIADREDDSRSAYSEFSCFKGKLACHQKAESVLKSAYHDAERALKKQFDKNRDDGYCDRLQYDLTRGLSRLTRLLHYFRTEETEGLIDEINNLLIASPVITYMRVFNDELAGHCKMPDYTEYRSQIMYEEYNPSPVASEPGLLKILAAPFCQYGYELPLWEVRRGYYKAQESFEESFYQEVRTQIHLQIIEPVQLKLSQAEAKLQQHT